VESAYTLSLILPPELQTNADLCESGNDVYHAL